MSILPLTNPREWEVARNTLSRPILIESLEADGSELAKIRMAEVICLAGDTAALHQAADLINGLRHPLAEAMSIMILARLGLWHEAYAIVRHWNHPSTCDLSREANCLAGVYGAMVARHLGHKERASHLLGRAEALHEVLGLEARKIMIRGEVERTNTLDGYANPSAIRAILATDKLSYRQRQHNTHNLAEALGSRGDYAAASAELIENDPRSVGMRAFYNVMLNQPIHDPGGNDDWLRLARTARALRYGLTPQLTDLECVSEPQATYARLLTAEFLARSEEASRRSAVTQLPIPSAPDQKVWWVMSRIGALSQGIQIQDAHRICEVWRDVQPELSSLSGILNSIQLPALTPRLLVLAALPSAPDQLLRICNSLPIITGKTIIQNGTHHNGRGRAGAVLVALAYCPYLMIQPLYGAEPKRWDERVAELRAERLISGEPANPGLSLRAAVAMRDAMANEGMDTTDIEMAIERILTWLSEDSLSMIYAHLKGGELTEASNTDVGGRGTTAGPALARRVG